LTYKVTTYKTLEGVKEIVSTTIPTQWVVYQKNKPKYFVDLYDLNIESNAMMNSLVL
jgi:hypothetical protein